MLHYGWHFCTGGAIKWDILPLERGTGIDVTDPYKQLDRGFVKRPGATNQPVAGNIGKILF